MATLSEPTSNLQPPGQDEDMEISSNYGRLDEDIDIDIDFSGDPSHGPEDAYMVDEAPERLSGTIQDDLMVDEDANPHEVEDGVMRDDVTVPDEHLTDASEIGDVEDTVLAPTGVDIVPPTEKSTQILSDYIPTTNNDSILQSEMSVSQQVSQPDITENKDTGADGNERSGEQTDFDPAYISLSVGENEPEPKGVNDTLTSDKQALDPSDNLEEPAHVPEIVQAPEISQDETATTGPLNLNSFPSPKPDIDSLEEQQADHQAGPGESSQVTQEDNTTSNEGDAPSNVDTNIEVKEDTGDSRPKVEENHVPHPCVVVYQHNEISLFPPSDENASDTFFLDDESLLFQSIGDLLRACRVVLGETITLEDELELSIQGLGLIISEDSAHAFTTTFAQVLEVYVQLHNLDGNQSPEPLYINLSTKTRFSSRLTRLSEAVVSGKGLTQLDFVDHSNNHSENQPEHTTHAEHGSSNVEQQDKTSTEAPVDSFNDEVSHHGPPDTGASSSPEDGRASEGEHDKDRHYELEDEPADHSETSSDDDNSGSFDQDRYAEQVDDLDQHANNGLLVEGEDLEGGDDYIDFNDEEQGEEDDQDEEEEVNDEEDVNQQEDTKANSSESSTLQGDAVDLGKDPSLENDADSQSGSENEQEIIEDYGAFIDAQDESLQANEVLGSMDNTEQENYAEQENAEPSYDLDDLTHGVGDDDIFNTNHLEASEAFDLGDETGEASLSHQEFENDGSAAADSAAQIEDASLLTNDGDNNIEELFALDEAAGPEHGSTEYHVDTKEEHNKYIDDFEGVDYEDAPQPTAQEFDQSPATKRSHAEYEEDFTAEDDNQESKRIKST